MVIKEKVVIIVIIIIIIIIDISSTYKIKLHLSHDFEIAKILLATCEKVLANKYYYILYACSEGNLPLFFHSEWSNQGYTPLIK